MHARLVSEFLWHSGWHFPRLNARRGFDPVLARNLHHVRR
jgi:hypothetical protein